MSELCKHFTAEWIYSLHSVNPKHLGWNLTKDDKGNLGEDTVVDTLTAIREVDKDLVTSDPLILGEPSRLAITHDYPDVYVEASTGVWLFEVRNIFWHPNYNIQDSERFVRLIKNKAWNESEYLMQNAGIRRPVKQSDGRWKTTWCINPNRVIRVPSDCIKQNLIKKAYVTTVPFLPERLTAELDDFFEGRVCYARHPMYSEVHVVDEIDEEHLKHSARLLTARLMKMIQNE